MFCTSSPNDFRNACYLGYSTITVKYSEYLHMCTIFSDANSSVYLKFSMVYGHWAIVGAFLSSTM